MKKLSIITICYNEPNLEKTCESIVNQTWQDFEWIVIDGGSNEETQQIWNKYKGRIDKFVSESDSGIYNACNKGLNLVNGVWVNFMNSGDTFYDKDVLLNIFQDKEYSSDILYGNTVVVDPNRKKSNKVMLPPSDIKISFFMNDNINTQSSFIRYELFQKYGFYNENFKILGDYEKWLIFIKNNSRFEYIPLFIAYYDYSGISSNKKMRKIAQAEKENLLKELFSADEIKQYRKEYHQYYKKSLHYSPLEQIFSVKNNINKTHKILTILGIHIKIRRNLSI